MHRFLLQTPVGMVTDHKNGNRLDNRRENITVCTQSENLGNKSAKASSKTGYKGIYWDEPERKWKAEVKKHGVKHCAGGHKCMHDAAQAYNDKAVIVHGEFAHLNIIRR